MTATDELVEALRALAPQARGMTADSRRVRAGDVFLAYPGARHDGRTHIADALHAGAAAVLWEPEGHAWDTRWRTPHLPVSGLRQRAPSLAAAWYGQPSRALWMCGVTGTNGKTTVTRWIAAAHARLGSRAAVIGTLGNGLADATGSFVGLAATSHTTPDAVTLHGLLAEYLQDGARVVAMEVSSHALDQGRVEGVAFDVAVLTNLSRDHLDYHGDMASYAAAKSRLFHWSGLRHAVLNADDAFGVTLAGQLRGGAVSVLTYGLRAGELRATRCAADAQGLRLSVASPWGEGELVVPLLGEFNAYNLLGALGALLVAGVPLDDALSVLARSEAAPGRMQRVPSLRGAPTVIVDYAHTPDALDQVLAALRPLTAGRLWCVFGCGGGRDAGKRPLMGAAVAARADVAIVTSDNPRNEEPAHIIADILAGMPPGQDALVDRQAAIHTAIARAAEGDVVLIAGKGHETYQEIAGVRHPFSDVEVASAALAQRTRHAPA